MCSSDLRRLVLFAGLLAAALLALHVPFFWQWDRFLLPTLPLLAALAGCGAIALARQTRPWVPALLLACGLVLLPPPRAWWPIEDTRTESTWLREIDATVPTDAVVVLRTDPFHFREILRGGRDDRSPTKPGRTASTNRPRRPALRPPRVSQFLHGSTNRELQKCNSGPI